jgi:hypothetical protein
VKWKAIHYAKQLYWGHKEHSRAVDAEYLWRQEWLEQIRKEMEELKAPGHVCIPGSTLIRTAVGRAKTHRSAGKTFIHRSAFAV